MAQWFDSYRYERTYPNDSQRLRLIGLMALLLCCGAEDVLR